MPIKTSSNYLTTSTPGKLQLLLGSNDNYLYGKLSPYTNYHDSLLSGVLSNQQPFVYTNINDAQNGIFEKLPNSVKSFGDIVGINKNSVDDVVRVSKFLISSWGVQFLITQAAIQRLAPFDETRIYNPLSSLLATVQPLTIGLGTPPTRHIEGGLLGLANSVTSLVGINLTNGFQTPSSTAGDKALPTSNTGQGKGLIRGGDANKGLVSLNQHWGAASQQSTGISGLFSSIANSFTAFFGKAPGQPSDTIFRADEQGYKIMSLGSTNLYQPWFASSTNQISLPITKNKSTVGIIGAPGSQVSTTFIKQKLISLPDTFNYIPSSNGITGPNVDNKPTGYPSGNKYGDTIGRQSSANEGNLTNSDMLVQFGYYMQQDNKYPTKLSNPQDTSVIEIQNQLQKVLQNIKKNGVYNATSIVVSNLLPSGQTGTLVGYDLLNSHTGNGATSLNTSEEYYVGNSGVTTPKPIDSFVGNANSLRMATSFMSDGINMLGIINGDKATLGGDTSANLNSLYPGWTEYRPYDDDLIAFFFYDVVNDKYIPFRATVKGISEGNTAFWDELRFIGRADQIYSYNGFSRTLSFTFNIVINSVNELLPSWKKINYMASSVKPSNYTVGQVIGQSFNRFIVPPMFMLTIGDLYKFQPMVMTSINVNIPDDASWETLNENNSKQGWSYLNGLITSPNLDKNYGQLPREAEIAITCNLLEKERATVGGSHFGHEPRVDDWEIQTGDNRFLSSNDSYSPSPTILHKNFVEWNKNGTPSIQDAKKTINNPTPSTQPFMLLSKPSAPAATQLAVPFGGSNTNNVAPRF